MHYEVKSLTVYIEGSYQDSKRNFTFFITVHQGYIFKIAKQLGATQLSNELRFPKFIITEKTWPENCPQEEIRHLSSGEYRLAYNSIIKIE